YSGLPAFHPLVRDIPGLDPKVVDAALKAEAAGIRNAGYNLRVVYMGPEQNSSILANRLADGRWDGVGVGAGIRVTTKPEATVYLEKIFQLFSDRAHLAQIFLNYNANSTLSALQRHFPISGCTKPGKNL
ncbi:hypothetical protein B0T26DRAFT_600207, partial [Lasiosphaeria miniovina]